MGRSEHHCYGFETSPQEQSVGRLSADGMSLDIDSARKIRCRRDEGGLLT